MFLASCATDVKLYDSPNYELAHIYRPADTSGLIRSLSWCKDGSWFTIVPYHGNAEIIRTKDEVHLLHSILGVAQPTAAVFQRTTKKLIAMSTFSGGILVYDIKARGIKKKFQTSGLATTVLDWNLKDTHLAAGNTGGQVTLFSNTTNKKSTELKVPASKSVSVVRFHRMQRHLLGSASDEGVVVVFDINTGKRKFYLQSHQAPVTDLAFSSHNHNLLTSVGLDRTFQCYDVNSDEVALSVLTDHPLTAVDMSPDGHTVAVASSRGNIFIYDLRDHKKPLKTIIAHSGEIKRVIYQPICTEPSESVNITADKPVQTETEPLPQTSSTDSFAQMLMGINELSPQVNMDVDSDSKRRSQSAGGDSFFSEFGTLDPARRTTDSFTRDKSELSNLGITDGVKRWIDSKHSVSQPDGPPQINPDNIPVLTVKASSTPRQNHNRVSFIQNQDMANSNISPILVTGPIQPITIEDIRKVVKETVTEIVSDQLSDLKDSLRRHFMDLQLCSCKQFVFQEEQIERLISNAHLSCNSNITLQMQQVQQENDFLKSKINELLKKNCG